jgi:hypothetical protein
MAIEYPPAGSRLHRYARLDRELEFNGNPAPPVFETGLHELGTELEQELLGIFARSG